MKTEFEFPYSRVEVVEVRLDEVQIEIVDPKSVEVWRAKHPEWDED